MQLTIGLWFLFALLVTAYYKTSLMAKLTVPTLPATIDSLQELLTSKIDFGSNIAKVRSIFCL